MFANLSSPKAVDFCSSSIKFLKGKPHLSSKISSFPQRSFLELFESCLSMKIIGNSFGNIDQNFIGSFNLNIFFLDVLISSVAIRMILD